MFSESFIRLIKEAIDTTNNKLENNPKYGVYIHAKEQLNYISSFIYNNRRPCVKEKENVNLGLMAVKELESSDPEYCDLLCKVNNCFDDL